MHSSLPGLSQQMYTAFQAPLPLSDWCFCSVVHTLQPCLPLLCPPPPHRPPFYSFLISSISPGLPTPSDSFPESREPRSRFQGQAVGAGDGVAVEKGEEGAEGGEGRPAGQHSNGAPAAHSSPSQRPASFHSAEKAQGPRLPLRQPGPRKCLIELQGSTVHLAGAEKRSGGPCTAPTPSHTPHTHLITGCTRQHKGGEDRHRVLGLGRPALNSGPHGQAEHGH